MKIINYIAICFLIMDSCIQPFNINVRSQGGLVVDGLITDQPGPYSVKIFNTLGLNDQLDVTNWVQGATVSIIDDSGHEEHLIEGSPGNYRTDSLYLGYVGKTYKLRFETVDGEVYESIPEKLLPVGDIDSLYYRFVQSDSYLSSDPVSIANGFNVFLNGKVLPEQEGLVRWRWTGTFGIKTYPEFKTKLSNGVVIVKLPDPPNCSGFSVRGGALEYFGSCTCCYCWVTQYSDNVTISDDKFITNGEVTEQQIAYIPANRRYLYDKYYLEVEQLSVSQQTYNFWKKVATQQTTGSNLFQTPPPPTTGNIQMITGKTPVLGIFSASGVKSKTLTFTKDNVPYVIQTIDTIANSCKLVYPYATTRKPDFW